VTGPVFVQQIIDLGPGPLSVHVGGQGSPVLCLHPAAGLAIRSVARTLAQTHQVICPIVPGYEGTPFLEGLVTVPGVADLLAEYITGHLSSPLPVVGHSMGARLGAWLTVRHPHLVERLMVMAPAGFRPLDAPPLSFEPEIFFKQLYAHPERRAPETRSPEQLAANRRAMAHYGIGAPRDEELMAVVGSISCPTLVVGGGKDVRVPKEAILDLHARIKTSSMDFIEDAAHSIETDQPEQAAAMVVKFLS
jgi:hypothetical protein